MRLASQCTPLAGWFSTPAATPVSMISSLRERMPATHRRSTSCTPTGRPPITREPSAALSEMVSVMVRPAISMRESSTSSAGTTYSVARSTSIRFRPGPRSSSRSTNASSISTRGWVYFFHSYTWPDSNTWSSKITP